MTVVERYTFGGGDAVALRMLPCTARIDPNAVGALPDWEVIGEMSDSDRAFADHDDEPDATILQTLDLLCRGQHVEIRVLTADLAMHVRRFTDHAAAAEWVSTHDGSARGIYIVLNPFDVKKIKRNGADDDSITHRLWQIIDFDPTRNAGTNATEAERKAAIEAANAVASYLIDVHGWSRNALVHCESGNGAHLLARIDLPNDEAAKDLLERILIHLAQRFDSDTVHVDQTVFNASRITKFYGTLARKGPDSVDRPHRRSRLTLVPELIEPVSRDAIERVAALAEAAKSPAVEPSPVEHGLDRATRKRLAIAYLASQPPAIQAQGGDARTYAVSCAVAIGHDLTADDTFEVMQAFNARCMPPWSEQGLRQKIRNAIRYGENQRGAKVAFRRHQKGRREGEIIADNQDNIRLGLALLGLSVSYNAFANVTLVTHQGVTQPVEDAVLNRAWLELEARWFRPSLEYFHIVVQDFARRNTFHPVREYLNLQRWDRVSRLDRWLITYGGATDTPYTRAIGAIFFIAAVRRVRKPGCKFDTILVLESVQGTKKSTAARTICPDLTWFSDDLPLGTDAKLTIERTAGKFIIEASELQGYSTADIERLKSFLSRGTDGPVRMSYARIPIEMPRQFILIGTTNELTQYLLDSTGNRRFWPVLISQFDIHALERDRDQLWAEAACREAGRVRRAGCATTGRPVRRPA